MSGANGHEVGVDYRGHYMHRFEGVPNYFAADAFALLTSMLQNPSANNTPIETLVKYSCDISEQYHKEIKSRGWVIDLKELNELNEKKHPYVFMTVKKLKEEDNGKEKDPA